MLPAVQLTAKLKRDISSDPYKRASDVRETCLNLLLSIQITKLGGLFLFLLMLMRKMDILSMQEQNGNLKETLYEPVTQLAVCRRVGAMSRETLGALHWMRYMHEEESSSATHFPTFTFPFLK